MRTLVLTVSLLLVAGMAIAGAGSIGIFADPAGMNCNLPDPGVGLVKYYVVQVFTTGSTGVAYSAPKPSCFAGTWLSDDNQFSVFIGTSQTDFLVGYGLCLAGTVHIQTMNFFTTGVSQSCCKYTVLKSPSEGRIAAVDCDFNYWIPDPAGGTGTINANPGCTCDVPAQEKTWGQVKSLYAE